MPAEVDRLIRRVMGSPGVTSKASAIAILKSRGVIKQSGKHLVMAKKRRSRKRKHT